MLLPQTFDQSDEKTCLRHLRHLRTEHEHEIVQIKKPEDIETDSEAIRQQKRNVGPD